MKRGIGTLIFITSLVACSADEKWNNEGTNKLPILSGQNESQHPETVLLLRASENGSQVEESCTAFYVSNRVLLTAAHCVGVFSSGPGRGCDGSGGTPADSIGSLVVPSRVLIYNDEVAFDSSFNFTAKDSHEVSQIRVPPATLDNPLCGNDVALIELAKPVTNIKPATVAVGRSVAVGDAVTPVGYGSDGANDQGGRRRTRSGSTVVSVGATNSDAGATKSLATEWTIDTGPCGGDSGSPAFNASGEVVGIMSRGAATKCVSMVYSRVSSDGGFGTWIRDGVREVATRHNEAPPGWVGAVANDAGNEQNSAATSSDGGGCQVGVGSSRFSGFLGIGAFGLILTRNRRRRDAATSSSSGGEAC